MSAVDDRFGNPLDLTLLKANVLRDYPAQVAFWKKAAKRLYPLSKPRRSCVLCGGKKLTKIGQTLGWPWLRCEGCTHVNNGRQLPLERYGDFYRGSGKLVNYSDTYTDAAVQKYRREHVSVPQVRHMIEKSGFSSGRWLDVASGNGDVLSVAKERGFAVKGVEISGDCVRFAKERYGIELFHGVLEDFAKTDAGGWDIISFLGIMDIVPDPFGYMKTARRLMKKGGALIVRFSHFDSLSSAAQLTYPDQLVCRHLYPSVIGMYTEESARRAVEKAGFRVDSMWWFGMDVYELINNLAHADKRFRGSRAQALLRELSNELQLGVDRSKKSDQFLMIARAA